jgi:hypothetical protein
MHVFNTWLIVNLLHPFIVMSYALIFENGQLDIEMARLGFSVLVISILASLPLWLLADIVMCLVKKLPVGINASFIIWLIICTTLPWLCVAFIDLLVNDALPSAEALVSIAPATVSILITILIRIKPFLIYINDYKRTNQLCTSSTHG